MEMLFLMLLMFFTLMIFLTVTAKIDEEEKKKQAEMISIINKEACPPHRWTYHPKYEKLSCTKCNSTPGVDKDEQDN